MASSAWGNGLIILSGVAALSALAWSLQYGEGAAEPSHISCERQDCSSTRTPDDAGAASTREPDSRRVTPRPQLIRHLVEMDAPGMHPRFWSQSSRRLSLWEVGLKAILRRPVAALRISEAQVRARIRKADAILVPDIHSIDAMSKWFGRRLLDLCHAGDTQLAIGLEGLTSAEADVLNARRPVLADALRRRLNANALWRTAGADDIAEAARRTHALFIGLATPSTLGAQLKPAESHRMATQLGGRYYARSTLDKHRVKSNPIITRRIASHAGRSRSGLRRRVVALIGRAHCTGANGIRDRLQRMGLSVLVLAPSMPEWELALVRRHGSEAEQDWLELAPNVIRVPYPTWMGEKLPANGGDGASGAIESPSVRAMRAALADSDSPSHLYEALRRFREWDLSGRAARTLIPEVVRIAERTDGSARVRLEALAALQSIARRHDPLILQAYCRLTKTSSESIKLAAAEGIAWMDARDPLAEQTLRELAVGGSASAPVAAEAALGLGAWLIDPETVVPLLDHVAMNERLDADQRVRAVCNLGHYGSHASSVLGNLRAIASQGDAQLQRAALTAAQRINLESDGGALDDPHR